jgi:hypothetical protein
MKARIKNNRPVDKLRYFVSIEKVRLAGSNYLKFFFCKNNILFYIVKYLPEKKVTILITI